MFGGKPGTLSNKTNIHLTMNAASFKFASFDEVSSLSEQDYSPDAKIEEFDLTNLNGK